MIDIHELKKQCPDYSFLHMDTVGSTNEYLKEHLDLPEKTVVIAEEQTRGKGRKGRSFYSPKGCGIYLSLLIKPQDSLDSVFDLTAITALSALKAIQTIYGITPSIKWLNDLLVHGQKIAGILCESLFFGSQIKAMIIGIGINVHTFERPAEIASVAASIEDFSSIKKPRSILIAKFLNFFDEYLAAPDKALEDYRKQLAYVNQKVYIHQAGQISTGIIRGIDDHFHLLIENEHGQQELLVSAEISIRPWIQS